MDSTRRTALRPDFLDKQAAILEAILASSDSGFLLTDLDHLSIACNPRFGELFGIGIVEVVAKSSAEVRAMVEHRIPDLKTWAANLAEVYADPTHEQTDLLELHEPRQFLRRFTGPLRDETGAIVGRLWTFLDVTEAVYQQRTRDQLFAISQLVDPDPGHVYREVVEAIGAFYGSVALLSIRHDEFLEFRAVGGPPSPARTMAGNAMADSFCQYCFEADAPLLIQDARLHPQAKDVLPARVGLTRYLGVPVRLPSGEVVGTLCILDERSQELLGEIDIEFMSLCATRIAAELAREQMIDERVRRLQLSRREQDEALDLTRHALERIQSSIDSIGPELTPEETCSRLIDLLRGFGGLEIVDIELDVPANGRGLPLRLPGGRHGRIVLSGAESEAARGVYVPALIHHVSMIVGRQILHDRLRQSTRDLQTAEGHLIDSEKLALSGTLAASIAHDIRNILATLAFDLAHETPSAEAWRRVRTQVERFQLLIHRLLVHARPHSHALEAVDLGEICRGSLALLEPLASAQGVSLELDEDEQLCVRGDGSRLEHLVVNLVLNAIEAMTRGGRVKLHLANTPTGPMLSVSDTGPGITEEVRDQLFEPFVTSRRNGFGLGLFSCRRIVEEHGGSLTLLATCSSGTTFEVRWPQP